MTWFLAIIIGAIAGVVVAQTQKLTDNPRSTVIAGAVGALAGFVGTILFGWLGQFIGEVALVAALSGLAVYGLKQANVIK